ncbi:MAG: LemA family protein [Planctomycetota bacterium]
MSWYIVAGVAGVVALWGVITFNALVRRRNLVQEAWSGIDVQLKRRANLVPNLVETVKGYSAHERTTLEEVTKARAEAGRAGVVREREAGENALSQALAKLVALSEAYPNLKADKTFLSLHSELIEVEDQIQYARRYYNGTVRDYNIRVETFPSNVIAAAFGFERREFFQLETATERKAPKVEMGR